MDPETIPVPDRPSLARRLIRTEPVALVLLLALAVFLFAITMTRVGHDDPPAATPTTGVAAAPQ